MVFPLDLFIWNCRGGLKNAKKQRYLRFMCKKLKLSFMGLVESKLEVVDVFFMKKLWAGPCFKFHFILSEGRSGGLCLLWNSDIISNHVVINRSRWISLSF